MRTEGGASAALVREDVLVLLREKRYEEALALLYRARSESPDSSELQKSIDQIKEFLVGAYAKRLGGLDQIARPFPVSASRSPDVVLISRYIDGTSTFGDVAQMSPLGQLRTLQVLAELYPKPELPPAFLVQRELSTSEAEPPRSGLRAPSAPPEGEPTRILPVDEPAPDTARSASLAALGGAASSFDAPLSPFGSLAPSIRFQTEELAPPLSAPRFETEEARRYRETFALGTAAFVQRRFEDAIRAFEECERMRPGDTPSQVMLRRTLRDLESR